MTKDVTCVAGTPGNGAGKVVFTFTNPATSPFANAVTYNIPAFNGTAATSFTVAKGATVTKASAKTTTRLRTVLGSFVRERFIL